MNPGIFAALSNDAIVASILGATPCRIYPYGMAPDNVQSPYATYGVISGLPENTLDGVPIIDNMGTQIDIWSESIGACEDAFTAIRNVLELLGYMTSFTSATRDPETKKFTARMEFDLWVNR